MRILIIAGGGGHFAPALAVIQALPKEWEVLVVGRKYVFEGDTTLSLEYQTAQKLGIAFQAITTGRLQRKFSRHTVGSLLKMPVGLAQAFSILQKFEPDVVLSFGGYISVPMVLAASLLRIPIVLHEQVLGAGLANKIAAKFATKICISWESSKKFFPAEKVVLTGNPLREEFVATKKSPQPPLIKGVSRRTGDLLHHEGNIPLIYITGGSGGAHRINVLVEGCLEKLLQDYHIIHQTGDAKEFGDFDRLQKMRESLPQDLQQRYKLVKFVSVEEVTQVLRQADLVIARSGIGTVTEILYCGVPTLFIPFPYGQRNEQLENARFVKSIGLAEIAEQQTLSADSFYTLVTKMIHNKDEYKKYAAAAKKLVAVDAAEKIIEVIADVTGQKKV